MVSPCHGDWHQTGWLKEFCQTTIAETSAQRLRDQEASRILARFFEPCCSRWESRLRSEEPIGRADARWCRATAPGASQRSGKMRQPEGFSGGIRIAPGLVWR
jgi:hypothetical protein